MKKTLIIAAFAFMLSCQQSEPKPNNPTKGELMFWTTCAKNKDILIWIESQYQNKITTVYNVASGAPACGTQGSVTVTLPGGVYKWKAQTDVLLFPTNWEGTAVVTNGVCQNIKLTCQ